MARMARRSVGQRLEAWKQNVMVDALMAEMEDTLQGNLAQLALELEASS